MRNFLLFLLFLFLIAAALRIEFYFNLLYLLFGVYFFSRFWMRRTLEKIRIERRFVARAFLGEEVAVEVEVENKDWLPIPWLELDEPLPVQLSMPPFFRQALSLRGHEKRTLRYNLSCRQRGYYPLGGMKVRTGDLLGFLDNQDGIIKPNHLIVYPKVVPLTQLGLPTRSPLVALPARTPLFEDPSRIRGIRDYQRGDSPRRIHWTASASSRRLLVKQYEPAIARETFICLDLNEEHYRRRRNYTATELAIVVAASLANHIVIEEQLPVGLATYAKDLLINEERHILLPPRRERSHLMQILEVLARVQITTNAPFAERLRQESMRLSWGTTLTIITGNLSQSLLETLLYLRRSGFAVALILILPEQPSAELQKHSALLKVPIYQVWDEKILDFRF